MHQPAVNHAVNPGLATFFSTVLVAKITFRENCCKILMKGAKGSKLSKERRNRGVGDES